MNISDFYELKVDNLILRKINLDDRDFIEELFDDAETQKYYSSIPDEISGQYSQVLDLLISITNNRSGFVWIITENQNRLDLIQNEKCGFITFQTYETRENVRITFALHKSKRGKGIMTKSIQLILENLKKIDVETVEADIFIDDIASSKMISKLGFHTDKKLVFIDPALDLKKEEIKFRYLWKKFLKVFKCEICGANESSKFNVFEILDVESKVYEFNPKDDFILIPKDFDFAFSDVTEIRQNGTVYFYKISNKNSFHNFCSLQCAFNFSVKESAHVCYCDPNKDMHRGITPQTLKIYYNLSNNDELNFKGQPKNIPYEDFHEIFIPKHMFSQYCSNVKPLSIEKTEEIFTDNSLSCFFINENSFPKQTKLNDPFFTAKNCTELYETGRYHLMFRVYLSEDITEISDKEEPIIQEWELIKYIPNIEYRIKGVYHFVAWGYSQYAAHNAIDKTHHEGKNLFIDSEYFNKIILGMYNNPSFDDEKLRKTIGFELVNIEERKQ